jgi:hypothetical protein
MIIPSGSGAPNTPNSASVAGEPNLLLNESLSMNVTATPDEHFERLI